MALTPEELGLKKAEIVYLHTDDGKKTAIMVEDDLVERLKVLALKRGTSPSHILAASVQNAFDNPSVLLGIEMRYVRGRRA